MCRRRKYAAVAKLATAAAAPMDRKILMVLSCCMVLITDYIVKIDDGFQRNRNAPNATVDYWIGCNRFGKLLWWASYGGCRKKITSVVV